MATTDYQADAWKFVSAGTCLKTASPTSPSGALLARQGPQDEGHQAMTLMSAMAGALMLARVSGASAHSDLPRKEVQALTPWQRPLASGRRTDCRLNDSPSTTAATAALLAGQ